MSRPSVKILISCHKPVCVPKSEVFLPIHVGSNGKESISGYQRDDCGENISTRNFTFCEMSGQYWAWKNLDADYVGQCHYRRYFCFDDIKHEANDHAQIEEDCLSDFSINQYHIADEERIFKALDGVDLVRAPYWNVKGVPTLCGPKKSVRDHMVAYGLITDSETDRLLEICKELRPDFYDDVLSYLNGHMYLGYNCFIMKRDLFNRLCDFEFSILLKFDDEYDYSHKTTTHKRICGYLGEILYSAFVAHVSKEGIKVVERPMVFFDSTPKLPDPKNTTFDHEVVTVVWRYIESNSSKFAVALNSFLNNLNSDYSYRLLFIHNDSFNVQDLLSWVGALPSNLEFVDACFPVFDLSKLNFINNEQELHCILPFVVDKLDCNVGDAPFVWIEGCALFQCDPALLIEGNSESIHSTRGVVVEKELNKPENARLLSVYNSLFGWRMSDSSCLVINPSILPEARAIFDSYCSICNQLKIDPSGDLKIEFKKYCKHKAKPGTSRDSFSFPISVQTVRSAMIQQFGASDLRLSLALPVVGFDDFCTWGNEETVNEYKKVDCQGLLLFDPATTPFVEPDNKYCLRYWALARNSSVYEPLLMSLTEFRPLGIKATLFPKGSSRYKRMQKLVRFIRKIR